MIRDLLLEIANCLNNGSSNYTVSFELITLSADGKKNPFDFIKEAFEKIATFENIEISNGNEVIKEVEDSLNYSGLEGAGPLKKTLESIQFNSLLEQLTLELKEVLKCAKEVWKFRLVEGHPFYPVYWDFAFLLNFSDKAIIIIGSSSD